MVNWQKWNSEVIKTFETLESRTLVKEVGPKNKKQTFFKPYFNIACD